MPVRQKHGRCLRIRSSEQRLIFAGGSVHAGSAEATEQQVREPVGDLVRSELVAWLAVAVAVAVAVAAHRDSAAPPVIRRWPTS
jgi:hypothetical protein